MLLVYISFDYPCRTHQYGIWQSNDVYFVVIYYAIPAYYPELELQVVFLSGFNANHLYKAKSRKIEATGTQAELLPVSGFPFLRQLLCLLKGFF